MKTLHVPTPTSRCRVGIGRVEITPPIGIYHRFWGAAKHDQATGVHRPLTASVLIVQPLDASNADQPHVLVAIDHCLFRPFEMDELAERSCELNGVDRQHITFFFSHTHSGGHIARHRSDLPGGDKIGPYLDALPGKIHQAYLAASDSRQPATLSYARTTCDMGRNRDCWDADSGQYVCGFNPDAPSALPVWAVRMTDERGRLLGTVVNYPCHPTTLAWDNTLISPDYVGALREVVESTTGAPCTFLVGACGDIGPKHGFVGNPAVADRNGRQVAYAALGALESLPPPDTDFHYAGPVLSGATIGTWEHRPFSEHRRNQTAVFQHRSWQVPLAYRTDLPTLADSERELEQLLRRESDARQSGDLEPAQQSRVLAERQRRLLERLRPLPQGDRYPFEIRLWQLGDAFWVGVEGEPYHALQHELAARFAPTPVIVLPLAHGARPSYMPTREAYAKPLYQVGVSLLAPGCLEVLIDEIAAQIESLRDSRSGSGTK